MSRSFPTDTRRLLLGLAALFSVLGVATGCRQDMHDQEKLEPLEASSLFPDGRASRHPVEGTVARGDLEADHHLHEGKERLPAPPTTWDGEGGGDPTPPPEPEYHDATTFPFVVSRADLERGRERYDIHCAPCHSKSGHGDGMVVRRGLRRPPSFHIGPAARADSGIPLRRDHARLRSDACVRQSHRAARFAGPSSPTCGRCN